MATGKVKEGIGALAVGACRFAAVLACLAAAGCTANNVVSSYHAADLRQQIRRTDRPVLVFFYKWGCPTSVALEPGFYQLAKEYGDQVVFVRYMHVWPWLQITNLYIAFEHEVIICPTVILFVNGQERKRWFSDYYLPNYRKGIDRVLAERTAVRGPAGQSTQPDRQ